MDWLRGLSRIVIALWVFSAPDFYIVFGLHDREAAVPSGRPRAGQKLAREVVATAGRRIGLMGAE